MKKFFFLIALYSAWTTIAKSQEKTTSTSGFISISVLYDKAEANDSLILKLIHSYGQSQYDPVYQPVESAGRRFRFKIPVTEACGYFMIQKKRLVRDDTTPSTFTSLTPVYLWENNDQVEISIYDKKPEHIYDYSTYVNHYYQFSGKGHEKYLVQDLIDSTCYHTPDTSRKVFIGKMVYYEGFKKAKIAAIGVLDRYKGKLSADAYHIMKSDILFYNPTGNYNMTASFFKTLLASGDSAAIRNFMVAYNNSALSKANNFEIPAQYLARSTNYLRNCLRQLHTNYFINHGTDNADSLYYEIKKQFRGSLQEHLLVAYFLNYRISAGFDRLFNDATASIGQPHLVDMLKKIRLRLPGMQAYNFSLSDTAGKLVQLSDFKGKAVLIDLWFTGCAGCSNYFSKTLSKVEKYFEHDTSVVFISVSIDVSKDLWAKGMRSGLYTSSTAVNLYTSGKGASHPFIDQYGAWSFPTAILIDRNMKMVKYNTLELFSQESLIGAIRSAK